MIQTFQLKTKEVTMLTQRIPFKKLEDMQVAEKEVLNALEEAVLKGKAEGEVEGEQKGSKKTEIKKNIETIVGLIKKFPDLPNVDIMIISKADLEFIAKVRATFQTDKSEDIKQFVREVYQQVFGMREKDFQELEEITLQLWKEYK